MKEQICKLDTTDLQTNNMAAANSTLAIGGVLPPFDSFEVPQLCEV